MSSKPLRLLVLNGAATHPPDVAALLGSSAHASDFQTVTRSVDTLRVIASATHNDDRRRGAVAAARGIDVVVVTLDDEVIKLRDAAVSSGIETLADIGVPVVLLLGFGAERPEDFAVAAGWLLKHVRATISIDAPVAELTTAIRAAAAGLVVLEQKVADALAAAAQRVRPRNSGKSVRAPGESLPLSAREREVLALLAHGHATKNIAGLLGISSHTVKAHVESIFAKFGATTRAEAVAIGVRRGAVML